jgi:hypothetical protein
VALGIFTPTSTTEVETKILISLSVNFFITSSFSSGLSLPCTNPTFKSGKIVSDNFLYSLITVFLSSVASRTIRLSAWSPVSGFSIKGHITN